MAALILLFIQGGRYITTFERIAEDRDPGRNGVVTEASPIELKTLSYADEMAKTRLVGSGVLDNPNLINQAKIDGLKAESIAYRNQRLDFYRAFRHPTTPDKKPLIIELEASSFTIETIVEFDQWVLTTFYE